MTPKKKNPELYITHFCILSKSAILCCIFMMEYFNEHTNDNAIQVGMFFCTNKEMPNWQFFKLVMFLNIISIQMTVSNSVK